MHGFGASLREFVRFARPWERVVLGVALFVIGAVTSFYFLSALGVVIAGVTIMGALRRRREAAAGAGSTGVSETDESRSRSASRSAQRRVQLSGRVGDVLSRSTRAANLLNLVQTESRCFIRHSYWLLTRTNSPERHSMYWSLRTSSPTQYLGAWLVGFPLQLA